MGNSFFQSICTAFSKPQPPEPITLPMSVRNGCRAADLTYDAGHFKFGGCYSTT